MKKRILAFTLILMMLFSLAASAATEFTDITKESHPWAYDAVMDMSSKGIINGTSSTTFTPDSAVTRMQTLLLLARITGYNSTAVKEKVNDIYSIYEEELSDLATTYKNELAFLAFMNYFTVDEFKEMNLSGEVSREEAALFLAKASGVSADEISGVHGDTFSDDKDIKDEYKPYVYYVRDKGYMTGVADGVFAPKTVLTRAQIATMLYRVLPDIDYTFEKASVDTVSASKDSVKVFVSKQTHELKDSVVVRNNGEVVEKTSIYEGLYGFVKMVDGEIVQLDVFFEVPETASQVDGLVNHIGTTTNIIQIKDVIDGKTFNYKLHGEFYKIIINGTESSLSQLRVGDYVVLSLDEADRIVQIEVSDTSAELTDLIITDIEVTDKDTYLTVEEKNGTEHTFDMGESAPTIRKNGTVVSFTSLGIGDKISKLQLLYNRIKSIDAYSEITSTRGVITTIHISDESYIVLKNNGQESTFNLNNETAYKVYGEAKTIYGLQIGQTAEITLDGTNVSEVEVTLVSQTTDVKGTVLAVNTSANFLSVQTAEGDTVVVYVSLKANSATKIIDNNSTTSVGKTLKNINEGASITALGAMINGVFEATTIVYSNN